MDVLLARQYNLISCMAEQGMSNGNGSGKRGNSLEEKTLGEVKHTVILLLHVEWVVGVS